MLAAQTKNSTNSTNSIQINMYTFLFESMEWNTKNYIDDS